MRTSNTVVECRSLVVVLIPVESSVLANLVWSSDDVSGGEDGGGSGNTCLRLSIRCNTYHVCVGWASVGLVCNLDQCWARVVVYVWVWLLESFFWGCFI